VADSVALLSSVQVSVLSTLFAKELLGSPELPTLIQRNRQKLRNAYLETTRCLKRAGITYFPCNGAVFLFCRLAPNAKDKEDEMTVFQRYIEAGVMVAPGRAYHVSGNKRGWMRVSFALEYGELQRGLARIESVYQSLSKQTFRLK
jgi:aspartate/methionine/tyrosine aminotransferase